MNKTHTAEIAVTSIIGDVISMETLRGTDMVVEDRKDDFINKLNADKLDGQRELRRVEGELRQAKQKGTRKLEALSRQNKINKDKFDKSQKATDKTIADLKADQKKLSSDAKKAAKDTLKSGALSAAKSTAGAIGGIATTLANPVVSKYEAGMYGNDSMLSLSIPMVVPASTDKTTARKLALIQQSQLVELIEAHISSEITKGSSTGTKEILSRFVKENSEYVEQLELQARKIDMAQISEGYIGGMLSRKDDFDGVADFETRARSTGVAKSPYVFIKLDFTRHPSFIGRIFGVGATEITTLTIGIRVYTIFENDKILALEAEKILDRKGSFSSLWKRVKNRNKLEMSVLDVLRGKDVIVRRSNQSKDLNSKQLGLILSQVLVKDHSWLSSIERAKVGGAMVLNADIIDYLSGKGHDIMNDPYTAKQFMVYSQVYDLYVIDDELDTLYRLDKQSFTFQPYQLDQLVGNSSNIIKSAKIDFK